MAFDIFQIRCRRSALSFAGTFPGRRPSCAGSAARRGRAGTCDKALCRSATAGAWRCLGHGEVEDEACTCERTWRGRHCEVDALSAGAPPLAVRVMDGIDLGYVGPLLMSKKQIQWADRQRMEGGPKFRYPYIALPPGTTRNRTYQGDVYELTKEIYHLLPDTDERLTGHLDTSGDRERAFLALHLNATHGKGEREAKGARGEAGEREREREGGGKGAGKGGQDGEGEERKRAVGTCAVIGNSGTLLHVALGHEIDAHDMVYRFNQAPTLGFEKYTGTRCTHESLNSAWAKALLETIDPDAGGDEDDDFPAKADDFPAKAKRLVKGNRWRWRKRDTALMMFELFDPASIMQKSKEQNANKDRWWKKTFTRIRREFPDVVVLPLNPLYVTWAFNKYDELKRKFTKMRLGNFPGEKPMSGFYAILFLLQICDTVDLYGFTAYSENDGSDIMGTKYHYFDNAVPRHNSHSFDLTQYIYRAIEHGMPNRLRIRS